MPIMSLRIAAILAIVFLFTEAPTPSFLFGNYSHGVGDTTLFCAARGDTVNETDAMLIECVLPGKIRPLGSTTYITPEQTINTTKKNCEARGGRSLVPKEPGVETPSGEPTEQDDHYSK